MVGDCGTKRAVTRRRPRPPLNEATLNELALAYVGRFATSRAKLGQYLTRKLRERGWDGQGDPPVQQLIDRCARSGFIDDAAFALSKARSLTGRGYGAGRVRQSLNAAGISDDDGMAARRLADAEAVEAALKMARRKRIGPYAAEAADRPARDKALAALVRAGHAFAIARAVVDLAPGAKPDLEQLKSLARQFDD